MLSKDILWAGKDNTVSHELSLAIARIELVTPLFNHDI